MKFPVRYVPVGLSPRDAKRQAAMLRKSTAEYKRQKYSTRPPVRSFRNRTSKHEIRAQRTYHVPHVVPDQRLARATGCSVRALRQIVKKGQGAYYSSGSRPNQTAHSWGYARLASALTAGKAAAVDFAILAEGCDHQGKAFQLAKKARRRFGNGLGKTRKRTVV